MKAIYPHRILSMREEIEEIFKNGIVGFVELSGLPCHLGAVSEYRVKG